MRAFIILLTLICGAAVEAQSLRIGDSSQVAIYRLGRPEATMSKGDRKLMVFEEWEVLFYQDRVARVRPRVILGEDREPTEQRYWLIHSTLPIQFEARELADAGTDEVEIDA